MSSIYYKNQKYTGPTLDLGSGSLTTDDKTIVGGINELDAEVEALSTVNETTPTSTTVTFDANTKLTKQNSVVHLQMSFKPTNQVSSWTTFGTLPVGYRPPSVVWTYDIYAGGFYQINPDGSIQASFALPAATQRRSVTCCWIIK